MNRERTPRGTYASLGFFMQRRLCSWSMTTRCINHNSLFVKKFVKIPTERVIVSKFMFTFVMSLMIFTCFVLQH